VSKKGKSIFARVRRALRELKRQQKRQGESVRQVTEALKQFKTMPPLEVITQGLRNADGSFNEELARNIRGV
jgi:ribosome maturation protein Sdo1